MKSLIVLALFLLPAAALAADEPEVVYGKYHRAAMAGDLTDVLTYGPQQRRTEMQGMPAAHREAALKMVQHMMPRAFKLDRKTLHSKGRATLIVSGPWEGGRTTMDLIYGTVEMLQENGAWKVDQVSWNPEKPAILSQPAKPAAPPAAAAKGPVAPAASKGVPAVASKSPPISSGGGKLGAAKPECVYKPVMTAQDLELCR